jgi:hypothetical protein
MKKSRDAARAGRTAAKAVSRTAGAPPTPRDGPSSDAPIHGARPRLPAWRLGLVVAGLIALNLVVYAPVRHYEFVQLDDPAYVTENPDVTRGITAQGVAWALTTGHSANWHPLTWLSHMLDVQMFGLNAGAHHATSVVLHIASTLLLFALLLRMTGAPGRSAVVAALFAAHPLHVESVAWVAERKDVLSTLFWMLTLWAYVGYVRRPRWTRYAAVVVLFALGLMAKPMLVTLPFVLLLLDVWPLGRLERRPGLKPGTYGETGRPGLKPATASVGSGLQAGTTWAALVREKLPLFAMAIASGIVTFVVQQRGGAVTGLEASPFALRLENALVSYVAYMVQMIWPAGLTVLYPFADSVPGWQVAGSLLLLAGISFGVVRAARRHPYLPVGWLWYVGTLVPVSGLIRVGLQARADRYTYVPLIGLFIIIAWGVADLLGRSPARRLAAAVAATLAILACTVTARGQVEYWKDDVALWTRATMLTLHVDEYHAHVSLGRTLTDQGRLGEAVAHFSRAVRLQPASAEARLDLGVALTRQGKTSDAIASFEKAVNLQPDFEQAHVNLAIAFANTGRFAEAIREFNEALRINPDNEAARRAVAELTRRGPGF